jgi:hypothetical protein
LLLLRAALDLPKRAELHIAERLPRKAEELLARDDYIKATERPRPPPRKSKLSRKEKS